MCEIQSSDLPFWDSVELAFFASFACHSARHGTISHIFFSPIALDLCYLMLTLTSLQDTAVARSGEGHLELRLKDQTTLHPVQRLEKSVRSHWYFAH